MIRTTLVLIVCLLPTGLIRAADTGEPAADARDQATLAQKSDLLLRQLLEEEFQAEGRWHPYPFLGQLLDEGDTSGPRFMEARREFEKRIQEVRLDEQKRRRHLEQFRLLKLLELLELDEAQEAQFIQSFTRSRQELRKTGEAKRETLDLLALGLHTGEMANDEIYALMEKISNFEKEKRKTADRFLEESRAFLTAPQLGKLLIFQERFEFELLDNVRQFQERGRKGMGPGGFSDG